MLWRGGGIKDLGVPFVLARNVGTQFGLRFFDAFCWPLDLAMLAIRCLRPMSGQGIDMQLKLAHINTPKNHTYTGLCFLMYT